MNIFFKELQQHITAGTLLLDEPMSRHTNFKIGGPCDALYLAAQTEELVSVLTFAREADVSVTIIGNGSNLLVSDAGIRGLVVQIASGFDRVQLEETRITAQSGILLSRLAGLARKAALTGLERMSGIPGTLGGAVFMNAGAYGAEMKDVVQKTVFLDENYRLQTLEGAEHAFGYRSSVFEQSGGIILEVTLVLKPGREEEIAAYMQELAARRREKQPLEYPSAGSTFKRPEGDYASRLIDAAGLRGKRVGGAQVSEKHAGFIINTGGATCSDVLRLMEEVQQEVWRQFHIQLKPEVRILGERN